MSNFLVQLMSLFFIFSKIKTMCIHNGYIQKAQNWGLSYQGCWHSTTFCTVEECIIVLNIAGCNYCLLHKFFVVSKLFYVISDCYYSTGSDEYYYDNKVYVTNHSATVCMLRLVPKQIATHCVVLRAPNGAHGSQRVNNYAYCGGRL